MMTARQPANPESGAGREECAGTERNLLQRSRSPGTIDEFQAASSLRDEVIQRAWALMTIRASAPKKKMLLAAQSV
jgi:hypothetical protein